MSLTLAIVSGQKGYPERLAEELCQKQFREWQVAGFSNLEQFLDWWKRNPVTLLLMEEESYPEFWKLEGRKEVLAVLLHGNPEKRSREDGIFMYQTAQDIGEQLMLCYRHLTGETGAEAGEAQALTKQETAEQSGAAKATEGAGTEEPLLPEIIGIASPCGGCGATGLAVRVAQELARRKEVLLLSLDAFCGLSEAEEGNHVSELLYLLREYGEAFWKQPVSYGTGSGRLLTVAGLADSGELAELTLRYWDCFLRGLRAEGRYRRLVIDFGACTGSPMGLLAACSLLIIPGTEETKLKKFYRQALRSVGEERIWMPGLNGTDIATEEIWRLLAAKK